MLLDCYRATRTTVGGNGYHALVITTTDGPEQMLYKAICTCCVYTIAQYLPRGTLDEQTAAMMKRRCHRRHC